MDLVVRKNIIVEFCSKTPSLKYSKIKTYCLVARWFGYVWIIRPIKIIQWPILIGSFGPTVPRTVSHINTKLQDIIFRLSYLLVVLTFSLLWSRKVTQIVVMAFCFWYTYTQIFINTIFSDVKVKDLFSIYF